MYNIWKTDEILGIHRNLHIQTISSFFLNYESQSWTPLTFSSITYWNWIMNISWLAFQLLNIDFNGLWLNKMVRPRRLLTKNFSCWRKRKQTKQSEKTNLIQSCLFLHSILLACRFRCCLLSGMSYVHYVRNVSLNVSSTNSLAFSDTFLLYIDFTAFDHKTSF